MRYFGGMQGGVGRKRSASSRQPWSEKTEAGRWLGVDFIAIVVWFLLTLMQYF